MGKGETENILTGSTQVQNYYSAQATLLLFNKVKANMPSRIDEWVMEIQDVD